MTRGQPILCPKGDPACTSSDDERHDACTPPPPKEWPILFSAPMVRALLAGRKTQTRRLDVDRWAKAKAGEFLWGRESWCTNLKYDHLKPSLVPSTAAVWYAATVDGARARPGIQPGIGRPSIFMPKWACRLWLPLVVDARLEALQDISEADCMAEGAVPVHHRSRLDNGVLVETDDPAVYATPRNWYRTLWDSINPAHPWDSNPTVAVLRFHAVGSREQQTALLDHMIPF